MRQVTVRFADDTSQVFEVDTAEASNETLRLYDEGGPEDGDLGGPPLLGQFRLRGEGAISGWWFNDTGVLGNS
jgi:hypothetical protein